MADKSQNLMERHNKQAIQQILSERDNKDFENKNDSHKSTNDGSTKCWGVNFAENMYSGVSHINCI